jgi:hypothetical protein
MEYASLSRQLKKKGLSIRAYRLTECSPSFDFALVRRVAVLVVVSGKVTPFSPKIGIGETNEIDFYLLQFLPWQVNVKECTGKYHRED